MTDDTKTWKGPEADEWRARRAEGAAMAGMIAPKAPQMGWLVPQNLEQVAEVANLICRAGWVPRSYLDRNGQPNQASVELAIMTGLLYGFMPLQSVQSIAVINGMPALFGDGMMAVILQSGQLEGIDEKLDKSGDDLIAVCTVKRKGMEPVVKRFSMAMAKKAGLDKKQGPWQAYPSRMLAMRARSWALRDAFADVLRGLAAADELMDAVDLSRGSDGTYSVHDAPDTKPTKETEPGELIELVDETGETVGAASTAREWAIAITDMIRKSTPEQAEKILMNNQHTIDVLGATIRDEIGLALIKARKDAA